MASDAAATSNALMPLVSATSALVAYISDCNLVFAKSRTAITSRTIDDIIFILLDVAALLLLLPAALRTSLLAPLAPSLAD
ncbi:hypothetical protein CF326_g1494 [Tilletia indica]|nr:hypothetical protein CF326_g1494 [Tilletia indica]